MIKNIGIDHKVLATHFAERFSSRRGAVSGMKELKDKWHETQTGFWVVYVKAYNYDVDHGRAGRGESFEDLVSLLKANVEKWEGAPIAIIPAASAYYEIIHLCGVIHKEFGNE